MTSFLSRASFSAYWKPSSKAFNYNYVRLKLHPRFYATRKPSSVYVFLRELITLNEFSPLWQVLRVLERCCPEGCQ